MPWLLCQLAIAFVTLATHFINNSAAGLFGTMFLLLCGNFGSTTLSSVSLLTVAMGFQGFAYAGPHINQLDLSPRFSGLLLGVSNTICTLSGILAPIVAKAIINEVISSGNTTFFFVLF